MTPLEILSLQQRRAHLMRQRRHKEANAILKKLQRIMKQELARK